MTDRRMNGMTDGLTEEITISPLLFKKSMKINMHVEMSCKAI